MVTTFLLAAGITQLSYAHTNVDAGGMITKNELTMPGQKYPMDLIPGASPTQRANYAWRLFIASMQQTTATLNSGAGRGVSDNKTSFIDTGRGSSKTNPLVFESFYHRTEAFPHYEQNKSNPLKNQPPSPINQVPTYYTFYKGQDNKEVAVKATGPDYNYVYLDETNQISQNFLFYKKSNNPQFPVLFMAKVNQAEAEYALKMTYGPNAKKSWSFPTGIIEVKTAWRRVKDIVHSDPKRYHQAQGTYWVEKEGKPVVHSEPMALIAIHIIQKTANYPQFIFTTFEHVDAVTRDSQGNITDPAYKTTYNNLAYQTPSQDQLTTSFIGAYQANKSGLPLEANKITRDFPLPQAGKISQDYTTVQQPRTITSQVNDVNNAVHKLIMSENSNNIWANYRLKGVQTTPTSNSELPDYYLANIVVESSQPGIQLFNGVLLNGGVPLPTLPEGLDTHASQPQYFVNCRDEKGSTVCEYPPSSKLPPRNPPVTTYKNVSPSATQGQMVPTPTYNMGGCQGCHGAAQQLGRDFSFLANGAIGKGKELDSVSLSAYLADETAAHNIRMIQSSNSH